MQITATNVLVVIDCGSCGVQFGVPELFRDEHRRLGGSFYCPNGHCLSYGKSESDKLKVELENARKALTRNSATIQRLQDESATAERKLSASKGQITKLKNRAAKGICPCCNEQFPDLHQHMQAAHPDYENEPDESCETPEPAPKDAD